MSRRNPKHLNLTPEQEAECELHEMGLTRARIIEMGVGKFLDGGQYTSVSDVAVAAQMLTECASLLKLSQDRRAEIRRTAEGPLPPPGRGRKRAKPRKKAGAK